MSGDSFHCSRCGVKLWTDGIGYSGSMCYVCNKKFWGEHK